MWKQIDSDASTLKAAGLERIIQVNEDIQDELADRMHRKTLPIPIHARRQRSYTKPSTITAAKNINENVAKIETQIILWASTAPNPNCIIHIQTIFTVLKQFQPLKSTQTKT